MRSDPAVSVEGRLRIAIIAPSTILPVPAVKGGAIETLITGLIDVNEEKQFMDITIFSPYHKDAITSSLKYSLVHFIWIRYNLINKAVNFFTRIYSVIIRKKVPHFGVLKILTKLRKGKFDKVVIEGENQLLIPISKVVEKEKLFFHLHARLFSIPEAYDYCNKVITVSKYIRNQVLINTQRVDEDIIVLKNCTDIFRFSRENNVQFREKVRVKYGISKNDVLICFTGRVVKEKGVKELLQAMLLIPEVLPFKLIIVGSAGSGFGMSKGMTDYFSELLAIAADLKDKVIFTGFIPNSEIPQILAASDISAIPSVYEEPGALTIFESLAAGLPVVTTDSGGIPEYLTNECSYVIKRNENFISEFSNALKELIVSKEKREIMGEAGFKHVQQFSYNSYYTDFLNILTGVEKY